MKSKEVIFLDFFLHFICMSKNIDIYLQNIFIDKKMLRDSIIYFFSSLKTLNGIILKRHLKEICLNMNMDIFAENNLKSIVDMSNSENVIMLKIAINNLLQKSKGQNLVKDKIITQLQKIHYNATIQEICMFISQNIVL